MFIKIFYYLKLNPMWMNKMNSSEYRNNTPKRSSEYSKEQVPDSFEAMKEYVDQKINKVENHLLEVERTNFCSRVWSAYKESVGAYNGWVINDPEYARPLWKLIKDILIDRQYGNEYMKTLKILLVANNLNWKSWNEKVSAIYNWGLKADILLNIN